jgi:SPP1 gp7 family putative phage head morphogenesis protein
VNARQTGLINALKSGIVAISGDYIKGKFTAALSKEIKALGGVWDKTRKCWKIDLAKLPMDVKMAIQQANAESLNKANKALDALAEIQKAGMPEIDLDEVAVGIVKDLQGQFEETIASKLSIPMVMTGVIAENLRAEYTENLNLNIKGWADESIIRLRGQIQEQAERGYRAESMQEAISAEYGVSERQAKFIARQETSLFVSKFREENYKEIGVKEYIWSTSHDSRVRPTAEAQRLGHTENDHRSLNGQRFAWDNPPVVNSATGKRAHPGCDFGCRCVAIPLLEGQKRTVV